jgi:hypothetical protein
MHHERITLQTFINKANQTFTYRSVSQKYLDGTPICKFAYLMRIEMFLGYTEHIQYDSQFMAPYMVCIICSFDAKNVHFSSHKLILRSFTDFGTVQNHVYSNMVRSVCRPQTT